MLAIELAQVSVQHGLWKMWLNLFKFSEEALICSPIYMYVQKGTSSQHQVQNMIQWKRSFNITKYSHMVWPMKLMLCYLLRIPGILYLRPENWSLRCVSNGYDKRYPLWNFAAGTNSITVHMPNRCSCTLKQSWLKVQWTRNGAQVLMPNIQRSAILTIGLETTT